MKYLISDKKNQYIKNKSIKLMFIYSLFLLFNISLCIECPRDKPILKNYKCENIYCEPKEYEKKVCVVSNPFIKTQWLNKINTFGSSGIFNICPISNLNGDVFLLASSFETNYGSKYLYAFSKDGNGFFYNDINKTYFSFEIIEFPPRQYTEIFSSVYIDNKVYLLSTQNSHDIFLIDIFNKSYTNYTLDTDVHYSESIFKLKEYDDENTYFTSYIYYAEKYNLNQCYLGLRIFKLDLTDITVLLEMPDKIQVHYKSKLVCFQNDDLYIQCIYNTIEKNNITEKFNHIISLFNYKTLKIEYTEILEENFYIDCYFDSTIQLNGNIFVTGYSYPNNRNVIKLLLKKFKIEKNGENTNFILEDYLPDIQNIDINSDETYILNRGYAKRNSMIKITDTKFAILLNEYTGIAKISSFNKYLIILIVNIFNDSKISIHHYKINFNLYDLLIIEDLRGYILNNFFGVLLETGVDTNSYVAKATFITFGYVNSTLDEIPIDKNLKENNTNSVIKLEDYISGIENNLFGYKFIGVKIIELPDRENSGYFINNSTNEEINVGDIVSVDTILRFILVSESLNGGQFSIHFAGVVQEPDYDEMNINAERIDVYPINDTELERGFYTPKTLIGRVIKYQFDLSCYDSCSSCYILSNNPNAQKCTQCKENYFFQKGTNNCFQSLDGYYLDNVTQVLLPCHTSCKTCAGPQIDSNHSNCLSCYEGFNLYGSKNCLSCPNYVNLELTECIDEIPEGYFLQNQEKGILGKCHELCKTCFDFPEMYNMNCIECKYLNYKFTPYYTGQCPSEEMECPREKPILLNDKICDNVYCTPDDFNNKNCTIYNSIIKTQWMNNIQRFGEGNILFVSLDYGFNDELFLFAQKRENNVNQNFIYGVNANGKPFFYDKGKDKYYSYKIIDFPNDIFLERIKFLKNYDTNLTFFLSTQIEDEMYRISYDIDSNSIYDFNYSSYSSDNIFTLKKYPEIYFTNFIHCQNNNLSDCYTYLRKFKFETNKNEITILNELKAQKNINSETNFICIDGYEDYIQCVFTVIEDGVNHHVIGLFNSETLFLQYIFGLEKNFETEAFMDSMISLNEEAFVISYSTEKNIIKILIKTIKYDYIQLIPQIDDYIYEVPYILINEDNYFDFRDGLADRNSLCKINDRKFALLINYFNDMEDKNYENPNILIYIFNIIYKININIRRYSINFKLYNMLNYGKILGYNLGKFFGILIELSSPDDKTIINSAFMTFGYVNTTEPTIIYDNDFILENNSYSKNIKFRNYIKGIENNLFGYEFLGVIILSLPDKSVGSFVKNIDDEITVNQTLNINAEIKLKLNENYQSGNYSIIFAGAVKEAEYEKMNEYAEEIIIYPNDTKINEKNYYEPQTLIGREIEYHFEIKNKEQEECYPSCLTCYSKTKDDKNHQCKICKPGYYFKEDTFNCYKEINEYYYFDEKNEIFSPCYIDCLTCNDKAINSSYMNCLSCENDYKFYKKSKNCLKCSKYVNYLQTECIYTIPDGYYLTDETFGIIEKCHEYCKTCILGPYYYNNKLYTNCKTCLYTNKNYVPVLEGDCPPPNDEEDSDEDKPKEGQCPREKPILKENKCKSIFCTKEEFDDGTCKINNDYIRIQWLNNFHIFDNSETSYVSYDINENGDLFLFAQRDDEQHNKKYLYGFSLNGTGILYEKSKKIYTSYKEFYHQFIEFIEKIKYIKINGEEYLLNFFKNRQLYLFDFNNNEIFTPIEVFNNIPYSLDTMIKLRGNENLYFFDYIYCKDKYILDNCYIRLMNYKIESINNFKLEASNPEDNIQVNFRTKLTCVEEDNYFIKCTYTTQNNSNIEDNDEINDHEHILGLFNKNTLQIIQTFVLEKKLSLDITFDSMIELKDNVCVIAYSIEPNIIRVILKKVSVDINKNFILLDYIDNVPEIIINEDLIYEFKGGDPFRNYLFKINEDEFAMLINDFKNNNGYSNLNSAVVIIIFRVYNFNRNIIVRHYKIDLSLYNMFNEGDIMGYKLNGFFGALIELTSDLESYKRGAAFFTFGYVNTTEDISIEEGTNDLINNKSNIKINDYITGIENNLFGYELVGVKILSLPNENNIGYFMIINNNNEKIKENDIIDINSELSLVINDNPVIGNYSISFAGVVKEAEFNKANNFSNKVENYPNTSTPEKYLNEPRTLIGKEFRYNFALNKKEEERKCYINCETCIRPSNNINEQDCLTCKEGFYFKDNTRNCYDKIEYQYYFNEKTKTFSPCYRDCYTCKEKEINSTYMNCLSCHRLYKLYTKTKNCLKCPRYVNYLQTDCIDTIPDGYFLLDEEYGTIGKCHDLCKTCKAEPSIINNEIHMNCETCLYENKKVNLIEGNCPEFPGEKIDEKEENKNDNNSNYNIFLWISIIVIILIIIVVVIITCKKCIAKGNSNYYNIEGKNIPFEDQDSFEIN